MEKQIIWDKFAKLSISSGGLQKVRKLISVCRQFVAKRFTRVQWNWPRLLKPLLFLWCFSHKIWSNGINLINYILHSTQKKKIWDDFAKIWIPTYRLQKVGELISVCRLFFREIRNGGERPVHSCATKFDSLAQAVHWSLFFNEYTASSMRKQTKKKASNKHMPRWIFHPKALNLGVAYPKTYPCKL